MVIRDSQTSSLGCWIPRLIGLMLGYGMWSERNEPGDSGFHPTWDRAVVILQAPILSALTHGHLFVYLFDQCALSLAVVIVC